MRLPKLFALLTAVTTGVAVMAISVATGSAASANPVTRDPAATTLRTTNVGPSATIQSSIATLDPYVTRGTQGWLLDAPAAVLAKLPAADVIALKQNIAEANKTASPGFGLSTGWDFRGPHGYVKQHWYGWELGIDGYLVGKLGSGLGAIGGVSGMLAAVGVSTGPALPVVAAVAGMTGVWLTACQHSNGWSIVYWVGGIPPMGGPVCNPFG